MGTWPLSHRQDFTLESSPESMLVTLSHPASRASQHPAWGSILARMLPSAHPAGHRVRLKFIQGRQDKIRLRIKGRDGRRWIFSARTLLVFRAGWLLVQNYLLRCWRISISGSYLLRTTSIPQALWQPKPHCPNFQIAHGRGGTVRNPWTKGRLIMIHAYLSWGNCVVSGMV